jgi:hypothetical protein
MTFLVLSIGGQVAAAVEVTLIMEVMVDPVAAAEVREHILTTDMEELVDYHLL